ncbi:hypothetical protein WT08_00155 [Burkholderia sp. MSMB1552]|nr:hypothetical protein WT08_00155 [Burkholderia sp. MSMB1552]KWZ50463.1 hypothetical protein WS92_24025 [Burkholderia sp. MSMB1588]
MLWGRGRIEQGKQLALTNKLDHLSPHFLHGGGFIVVVIVQYQHVWHGQQCNRWLLFDNFDGLKQLIDEFFLVGNIVNFPIRCSRYDITRITTIIKIVLDSVVHHT